MPETNTAEIPVNIQLKPDGSIAGFTPEKQALLFAMLANTGFTKLDFNQPAQLTNRALSTIKQSNRTDFQTTLATTGTGLETAIKEYGGLPINLLRLIIPFDDEQIYQLITQNPGTLLKDTLLGTHLARLYRRDLPIIARVQLDPLQAEALPVVAAYCHRYGFNWLQAIPDQRFSQDPVRIAKEHIARVFPETRFEETQYGVNALTNTIDLELLHRSTALSLAGRLCQQCALTCNLVSGGITIGQDGFLSACGNGDDRFDTGLALGSRALFTDNLQKIIGQNFPKN